jgi:hypothetical protein
MNQARALLASSSSSSSQPHDLSQLDPLRSESSGSSSGSERAAVSTTPPLADASSYTCPVCEERVSLHDLEAHKQTHLDVLPEQPPEEDCIRNLAAEEAGWSCSKCTFKNPHVKRFCQMCGSVVDVIT